MTTASSSSRSSLSFASTSSPSSPSSSPRPRYATTTDERPLTYHRRSGTLRTTYEQAQIARQRSKNLFKSVSDGQIAIDTILAIPIDWEGVAAEMQLSQMIEERRSEEESRLHLPTMGPWAVKTKARTRQLKSPESSPISPSTSIEMSRSSSSALGLDIHAMGPPAFLNRGDPECPSSPALSFQHHDSPDSCSASEYSVSTPPPSSSDLFSVKDDTFFDLKSYCSAFNDTDREVRGEDWWASSTATQV